MYYILDEIEANAVKDVSKTELLAFLDKKFAKNAPERRQMIIFVHGKSDNAENIGEKRKKRDVGDVKTSVRVIFITTEVWFCIMIVLLRLAGIKKCFRKRYGAWNSSAPLLVSTVVLSRSLICPRLVRTLSRFPLSQKPNIS